MPKLNLRTYIDDTELTHKNALNLIDGAQRARASASDKCDKILAPATLGASESSSAKEIFESIEAGQDDVIATGGDPSVVYGRLANYAAKLAESAKKRLIGVGE